MVGDGVQYPLVPRLDITQSYDGDGVAAKREQITRQPGIIDEWGNQSEPIVDEQTTYYVTSSVLGGATVVELGWGDTVHIYAGGQRIAREYWGSVSFEHHNPVTGSRVTSHGHSSYRTTSREERDPRGAETPLTNPFVGGAQDYVDWKFSQPLFMEGGDPFDYTSGLMIDGLPVSASEFARRANSGSLAIVFSGAISGTMHLVPFGLGFFGYDRPSGWRHDEEGPRLDWETATFSASGHSRWRQSHHPQNTGEQLSECLRNALREYFPQQNAQGKTYSPVDDSRFKAGIPALYRLGGTIPGTVQPAAITLGLFDIHYDPNYVNLSGGSSGNLKTILEEVSHTVQFLQVWAGLKQNPYLMAKHGIDTTRYESAQNAWQEKAFYHWAKAGGSYDNSQVELWAKKNANLILDKIVHDPRYQEAGNLCGFDLRTYHIIYYP